MRDIVKINSTSNLKWEISWLNNFADNKQIKIFMKVGNGTHTGKYCHKHFFSMKQMCGTYIGSISSFPVGEFIP